MQHLISIKRFALLLLAGILIPYMLIAQANVGPESLMSDSEIIEKAEGTGRRYKLDSTALAGYDKIVTYGKEVFVGRVHNITFSDVRYFVPGDDQITSIGKSQVSQILFADGRRDVFIALEGRTLKQKDLVDSARIIVKNQKDWMKVIVTEDPEMTVALKPYGRLKASYEAETGNADNEELMRQAGIILRKRAALLKAHYVLIDTKFFKKSYGDLPRVEVTAMAYGY